MIIGYSWGGATVTEIAKNASLRNNYRFGLVFTIDPVTTLRPLVPDFTTDYGAENPPARAAIPSLRELTKLNNIYVSREAAWAINMIQSNQNNKGKEDK